MNTVNKILHKIIDLVSEVVFPSDQKTQAINALASSIVRLTHQKGDSALDYPCPAYSFFAYRNPVVKNMIWQLKYRGKANVVKTFAVLMYDQLCEELSELYEWSSFDKPLLIPIPISRKKKLMRGYNQSALICKALSEIDKDNFFTYKDNVLYKIKDTISQARVKDRRQRLLNLKDSFVIKDISLVTNKNIILVDDVLTTGSTLTEATDMLVKAGAKSVIWIIVAH